MLKILLVLALALISILFGMMLHRRKTHIAIPRASVLFPDLADGDCAIIRTPDRRTIVIDSGGPASGATVASLIRRTGSRQIDLLILASTSVRGLGGTLTLIRSGIPIQSVWSGAAAPNDRELRKIVDTIVARQIPYRVVHAGEKAVIGNSAVRIGVVWPQQHSPRSTTDGVVIRLQYGDIGVLFLGPLEAGTENNIVADAGANLDCDVLQVSQNGSNDGTSLELLRRTTPQVAVISCGGRSPDAGVLKRLQSAGTGIWRTDVQGNITLSIDGHTAPSLSGSVE